MEVLYDLDTEASALAASLGINMVRAGTAGSHPRFVTMIRELIMETMDGGRPFNSCHTGCCRPESAL
jgi:protoporphyrin/coproporphyrin ferrochelatase